MIRVDGRGDSSSLIKVRGLNKTYSRGGEKTADEVAILQAGCALDAGRDIDGGGASGTDGVGGTGA